MKKKIAELWIKALKSNKFKQTKGVLKRKTKNKEFAHCCLGVLCELYNKTHKNKLKQEEENEFWSNKKCVTFDGAEGTLPNKVMKWSGIKTRCGEFSDIDGNTISLTELNDEKGKKFSTIAKVIEEKQKEL